MTALDTDTAEVSLRLPVLAGTLSHFADGSIAVTRTAASGAHPVHVGDIVAVRFGRPQLRHLQVAAILAGNGITRAGRPQPKMLRTLPFRFRFGAMTY